MLKPVLCLIAALAGLGAVVGLVLGVVGRSSAARASVAAPGCGGVSAAYGPLGQAVAMSIRADGCHPPGSVGLLPESTSFDLLGAAAWRTPGPSLVSIAITVDRSAERPDGPEPPRTLVLTGEQASARWGPRKIAPGSDLPPALRSLLNGVMWLCGFGVAGLLCATVMVLLARAARRGHVVMIWMR